MPVKLPRPWYKSPWVRRAALIVAGALAAAACKLIENETARTLCLEVTRTISGVSLGVASGLGAVDGGSP